MKYDETTPTKEITIAEIRFKAPMPFAPGHVCTAGEAGALNQTFHENVRNGLAASLKAKMEEATKAGAPLTREQLDALFNAYASEYEFGVRKAAGGFSSSDPVEREAMTMARSMTRQALQSNGYKMKEIPSEKLDELAQQMLAAHPIIRQKAKEAVDARASLGALTLGLIAPGAAAPAQSAPVEAPAAAGDAAPSAEAA